MKNIILLSISFLFSQSSFAEITKVRCLPRLFGDIDSKSYVKSNVVKELNFSDIHHFLFYYYNNRSKSLALSARDKNSDASISAHSYANEIKKVNFDQTSEDLTIEADIVQSEESKGQLTFKVNKLTKKFTVKVKINGGNYWIGYDAFISGTCGSELVLE